MINVRVRGSSSGRPQERHFSRDRGATSSTSQSSSSSSSFSNKRPRIEGTVPIHGYPNIKIGDLEVVVLVVVCFMYGY